MATLHPDLEAYLESIAGKGANTLRARRADLAGLSQWWAETRGQPFEPALLAERDRKAWVGQRQVADGATAASRPCATPRPTTVT